MPEIQQHKQPQLLVDTNEAARLLSLSSRTVWQLQADGELPSLRVGRALRFRICDLEQFAENLARGS